jgi:exopolysaccharide biosynthesis polyprenyl glycosylphosphotransferase
MFDERSAQFQRVTWLLDIGLTVLVFLAVSSLRTLAGHDEARDALSHVAVLPFVLALWMLFLAYFGAYRSPRTTSRSSYLWAVGRAVGAGVVALFTALFALQIEYVSRGLIAEFAAVDLLALAGVRLAAVWYFRRSLTRGDAFRRVLIVGSGTRAQTLAETLRRQSDWGITIVGHLDPDPARVGEPVLDSVVLGTVGDINSVLKENVIDQVVLAIPRGMIQDVDKIAQACEEEGVTLSFMADVFPVRVARTRLVELGPIPLLTLEPVAQEESKLLVKRAIDIALAGATLPVLLPLFALIALAITLDSRGPVFFVQERVGLHKRRFRMLKFRTMVAGADRMQTQVEHLNQAQGPIFKIANDPRITRVGRLLRRSSLDELPQILHVLTGQMSLVGPRPMSLRDVDRFDQGIQRKRFSVKPGLTCLWQVSGRSNLPFSEWLRLDLDYIQRWSLGLDVRILFRTIPAVLTARGAE